MCLFEYLGYFINDQFILYGFRKENKGLFYIIWKKIFKVIFLFINCIIIYLWLLIVVLKVCKI